MDCRRQQVGAHAKRVIDRHGHHAALAPAEDARRAVDAVVRLRTREHAESISAKVPCVDLALARGEQRREVAERSARRHHSVCGCRHAELLRHPLQRAQLHRGLDGAHLVDGHAVVEQRVEPFEQRKLRPRHRDLVAHVARVVQPIAVGEDAAREVGDVESASSVERRHGVEHRARIGQVERRAATFASRRKVVRHQVDEAMSKRAECGRVERVLGHGRAL